MGHLEDQLELLKDYAKSDIALQEQARIRYQSVDSYQAAIQSKYQDLHHWYKPKDGDQWPEDAVLRPDKIHVTANIIRPIVEIDARLQSIMPRFTIPTAALAPDDRKRAEATETIIREWLEMSGIEVWLGDLCRTKSLYGKGVLKPYWDGNLKRPDVTVVENPANLRIGWGSNDYTRMDWALYEYSLSHHEIMQRWPNVRIEPGIRHDDPPHVVVQGADHSDPLDQKAIDEFWRPRYRQFSDYERAQVRIWDYWYKDEDDNVNNMFLVQGKVAEKNVHKHLPDIPYVVIENDHEPGSPEGISTIEDIINLQEELNRLLSHGLQHVADDVDPAWFSTGPGSENIEPGTVPKAGEIIGIGEADIKELPRGANTFPIRDMMDEIWNYIRRETGISDIAFGDVPGADVSGRAIAIQVESMMNRLDSRRKRLYRGLNELIVFWQIMAERKNPSVRVSEDEEAKIADLIGGFRYWKIIPPEITPRDNFEVTRMEIDKVNARITSRAKAMDSTGEEAPEHQLSVIASENNNIDLNPEMVQIKMAVRSLELQLQQQALELQQMQSQAQPQGAQSVLAQAQGASNQAQNVQQGAQPSRFEDQNQGPQGQPGPSTQQGSAPPAGAGGTATTLTRPGQALSQIKFDTPIG